MFGFQQNLLKQCSRFLVTCWSFCQLCPRRTGFLCPRTLTPENFAAYYIIIWLTSAVGVMLSTNWQRVKHDISIASCLVKAQDHISGFLRTFPRVDHWVNGGAKGKQTHLKLCFHVFLFSSSPNLDGGRGEGDHLDPCLTRPVFDLCTCGHFVLKLGCLSKDGWTGIIYLSLCSLLAICYCPCTKMIQVQSTLGSFWRQVCVHRATAISLIDFSIVITSNFTKLVVYMIKCKSVRLNIQCNSVMRWVY